MTARKPVRNPCPRCGRTTYHGPGGVAIYLDSAAGSVHAGCMTQNDVMNLPVYFLNLIPTWGLSEDTLRKLDELTDGYRCTRRRLREVQP